MRVAVMSLVGVGAWVLAAGSAAAQDPAIELELDYGAADGCPTSEQYVAEVEAQVGAATAPTGQLRVRVFADGLDFVGWLERPGTVPHMVRSDSCAQVVARLAAALLSPPREAPPAQMSSPVPCAPPSPQAAASTLQEPYASPTDRVQLLAEVEALELQLVEQEGTALETGLLVSGVILSGLSLVAGVSLMALVVEDELATDDDFGGGLAAILASGAAGVGLTVVGSVMLTSVNARRSAIERQIRDRRRLLEGDGEEDAGPTVAFGVGPGSLALSVRY